MKAGFTLVRHGVWYNDTMRCWMVHPTPVDYINDDTDLAGIRVSHFFIHERGMNPDRSYLPTFIRPMSYRESDT